MKLKERKFVVFSWGGPLNSLYFLYVHWSREKNREVERNRERELWKMFNRASVLACDWESCDIIFHFLMSFLLFLWNGVWHSDVFLVGCLVLWMLQLFGSWHYNVLFFISCVLFVESEMTNKETNHRWWMLNIVSDSVNVS